MAQDATTHCEGLVIRLYPNAKQRSLLIRTFGCARFVHNKMVEEDERRLSEGTGTMTLSQSNALLTALKRELPWLCEVDSRALQQETRFVIKAYSDHFQNPYLAAAIAQVSFGEVLRQLEYKCAWSGRGFVQVSPWFPSSKTCSVCGDVMGDMPLSVREWVCPTCGSVHDRDVNAARNVLCEGQRLLAAQT